MGPAWGSCAHLPCLQKIQLERARGTTRGIQEKAWKEEEIGDLDLDIKKPRRELVTLSEVIEFS